MTKKVSLIPLCFYIGTYNKLSYRQNGLLCAYYDEFIKILKIKKEEV